MKTLYRAKAERLVDKYREWIENLTTQINHQGCTDKEFVKGKISAYENVIIDLLDYFNL